MIIINRIPNQNFGIRHPTPPTYLLTNCVVRACLYRRLSAAMYKIKKRTQRVIFAGLTYKLHTFKYLAFACSIGNFVVSHLQTVNDKF